MHWIFPSEKGVTNCTPVIRLWVSAINGLRRGTIQLLCALAVLLPWSAPLRAQEIDWNNPKLRWKIEAFQAALNDPVLAVFHRIIDEVGRQKVIHPLVAQTVAQFPPSSERIKELIEAWKLEIAFVPSHWQAFEEQVRSRQRLGSIFSSEDDAEIVTMLFDGGPQCRKLLFELAQHELKFAAAKCMGAVGPRLFKDPMFVALLSTNWKPEHLLPEVAASMDLTFFQVGSEPLFTHLVEMVATSSTEPERIRSLKRVLNWTAAVRPQNESIRRKLEGLLGDVRRMPEDREAWIASMEYLLHNDLRPMRVVLASETSESGAYAAIWCCRILGKDFPQMTDLILPQLSKRSDPKAEFFKAPDDYAGDALWNALDDRPEWLPYYLDAALKAPVRRHDFIRPPTVDELDDPKARIQGPTFASWSTAATVGRLVKTQPGANRIIDAWRALDDQPHLESVCQALAIAGTASPEQRRWLEEKAQTGSSEIPDVVYRTLAALGQPSDALVAYLARRVMQPYLAREVMRPSAELKWAWRLLTLWSSRDETVRKWISARFAEGKSIPSEAWPFAARAFAGNERIIRALVADDLDDRGNRSPSDDGVLVLAASEHCKTVVSLFEERVQRTDDQIPEFAHCFWTKHPDASPHDPCLALNRGRETLSLL